MMASDKQVSMLVYKIKGDPELKKLIPEYFEFHNGEKVNYTFSRLGMKLRHITKYDAHLLINHIGEGNLEPVKSFLIKLF